MTAAGYVAAIPASGISIYEPIEVGSRLYIPTTLLETLLNDGLRGFSTANMALRTRSKVVKTRICEVLGCPAPRSFKRTQPRFPGQNFDMYVQKALNFQVWNQKLAPIRRYVLIRERDGVLANVRVVTGESLADLDRTGTLTQKYQARLNTGVDLTELISAQDTERLRPLVAIAPVVGAPTDHPKMGRILPIAEVFARLRGLIGRTFADAGRDQERNRGAALHRIVCEALGFADYRDDGQFPDVKAQLVEVKLQTAQTIDLGLVAPDSTEPLDMPQIAGVQLRHCDVRYAIFQATTDGQEVTIRRVYLTTGTDFFGRFPRFGGKVLNRKLQIPLGAIFL